MLLSIFGVVWGRGFRFSSLLPVFYLFPHCQPCCAIQGKNTPITHDCERSEAIQGKNTPVIASGAKQSRAKILPSPTSRAKQSRAFFLFFWIAASGFAVLVGDEVGGIVLLSMTTGDGWPGGSLQYLSPFPKEWGRHQPQAKASRAKRTALANKMSGVGFGIGVDK